MNTFFLRLFIFLPSAFFISLAEAKPLYLHQLTTIYPESRLTHACQTCHTVGKAMGPYGKDFVRLKSEFGFENMSQVWAELGKLDSDGDGKTNDQELKVDGDPNELED